MSEVIGGIGCIVSSQDENITVVIESTRTETRV